MDPLAPVSPEYEILAELGRGTTGVVYKVRDGRLNQIVALKMPLVESPSDRSVRHARFLREARVLASLNTDHDPDFPTIYGIGVYEGQPYLVRELVEGSTLEQLVTTGALGVREGVGVLAAMARAVQRLHGRGIAHRNLHPSNVLVAARGTPRLIGFGRVGLLAESDKLPSGASGTPAETDVRALQEILTWLGSALGQPIPQLGSVDSLAAFAEALEGYLQGRWASRPWWRFW
jgi:serine/threonine-protein kinase